MPSSAVLARSTLVASDSAASAPALPVPAAAWSTNAATAADWASIPERISASACEVRSSKEIERSGKAASAWLMLSVAALPAALITASRSASRSAASPIIWSALGAFGERPDLKSELLGPGNGVGAHGVEPLGQRARGGFGARQVLEHHRNVVAGGFGGAVERFAVALQGRAAGIEFAGDPAKLAGRLVTQLHQRLGHHRQFGPAVAEPLGKHLKQGFERLRFAAHRDDRAGEALGFLAAGAAKHQPDETEQSKRAGGDRDPLRDAGEVSG